MSATLTVSHAHADGLVKFAIQCEHGETQMVQQLDVGDVFPDDPSDAMLASQSSWHSWLYACACAPTFVAIRNHHNGRRLDG